MATCVIDVNDFELRAAVNGEVAAASPGYASVSNGQVEVGDRAQAQAQLHPRETENRFWRDLNTAPVHHFGKRVRHHADLAYLHLEHLRTRAGSPSEAVFAVPGSMTHEQLALLLGIAQACRLKPVALVDSAVAAGAAALGGGHWAHIDLQQHQAVITSLTVDDRVTRGVVEVLPGLGINAIRQACVRVITEAFVTHCRFDPLHDATTEQLLHAQLPAWLELLARSAEIRVQLDYRGARFDTRVERAAIVRVVAPLLTRVRAALPGSSTAVASHRLAAQPGFAEVFGATPVLAAGAAFAGLSVPPVAPGDQGIRLVTALRASIAPTIVSAEAAVAGGAPTHLLDQHRAFALNGAPLYLLSRGGCSRQPEPAAPCSASLTVTGAELLVQDGGRVLVNGRGVSGRVALAAGDQITFSGAGALFTAIVVLADDDA